MLYKSAFVHLEDKKGDIFFSEEIPEDFNQIKM